MDFIVLAVLLFVILFALFFGLPWLVRKLQQMFKA